MTSVVEEAGTLAIALAPPERRALFDLEFDAVTMDEALAHALDLARTPGVDLILTPNVDHVVRTRQDPEFKRICQGGSLVIADGAPIVWASRWLRRRLPERVAGSDLMPRLAAAAAREGLRYFFLGGTPGDAAAAAAVIAREAGTDGLCGVDCPPFGFERDATYVDGLVERIRAAEPDILFVGLGSPKQEKMMWRLRDRVDVPLMMAVGITFSFVAGTVKRAPERMQRLGLEWLWRLLREPRRLWRRYLRDLTVFPVMVLQAKLRCIVRPHLP